MKKSISVLCVAGVLACNLTGITINADAATLYCIDGVTPVFTLAEGEYGAALMTAQTKSCDFIAVTDGSILEEKDPANSTVYDILCGIVELSPDYLLEDCDNQTAELLSSYGENARYYRVYLQDTKDTNQRSEISRKFMLEHENVQDVILYDTRTTFKAKWNGFSMLIPYAETESGFSNQDLWDVQEQFGGIYTWQRQNDQYLIWQEQLKEWKSTTDTTRMTEEEIYNSRKAAGIPTDYEMMKYAYDDGEIVKEQYPDLEEIAVIQPLFDICGVDLAVQSAYSNDTNNIENYGQVTTQNAQSAWDGIGDTNGNAEVDASDASMILEYAAQAGTSAVTDSSVNAVMADVNADGIVNALDASLILTYSAQKGAGENISLHDICRNK
ncbi:MAG: hypothetical protein K2H89_12805 [Oscillospiraceae bacterium]|nr:hypothetical protein [Oscillospiraceae bacterium]